MWQYFGGENPASAVERVNAKQGFREFQADRRTIQGYEAVHMIGRGKFDGWQEMILFVRFSSSTASSIWQLKNARQMLGDKPVCI
jgi:hypothetical protein